MKEFVVAGIQIAPVQNQVDVNINRALEWIPKAIELNAELVVFPETATTGFDTGLPRKALWDLVDYIPGRTTEGSKQLQPNIMSMWYGLPMNAVKKRVLFIIVLF